MTRFARFGTICTILKHKKHPWRSVTFSKVAGLLLACYCLFLYPMKTSENLWFSDVFRGYRKKPVARLQYKTLLLCFLLQSCHWSLSIPIYH